jgi:hypothetical protein
LNTNVGNRNQEEDYIWKEELECLVHGGAVNTDVGSRSQEDYTSKEEF